MDNYYKILNVSKNASITEIKKAYLNELKKYHPDIYKGDASFAQDKTAKLNEIYSVLKDENLRKEYDKKTFGESENTSNFANEKQEEPNIFKELKERLKAGFARYSKNSNKPKKEKTIKTKNAKTTNLKKDSKTFKVNENKNEIICQDEEEEVIEKKEKIRLSIMIGSIILGFLLIIIFCLIF